MSDTLGHITVRIPIRREVDCDYWEHGGAAFAFVEVGAVEMLSHDVPQGYVRFVSADLSEGDFFSNIQVTSALRAAFPFDDTGDVPAGTLGAPSSKLLGHVTVRIPVVRYYESGDPEGSSPYYYAEAGDTVVLSHDIAPEDQRLLAAELADGDLFVEDEVLTALKTAFPFDHIPKAPNPDQLAFTAAG